jgi:hypothetical protein
MARKGQLQVRAFPSMQPRWSQWLEETEKDFVPILYPDPAFARLLRPCRISKLQILKKPVKFVVRAHAGEQTFFS